MFTGYLAMLATLLMWSGFFLSLRMGVQSALTLADIALLRFMLPAIVLLPFVIKHRAAIRHTPWRLKLGLLIGCGLPYLWVAGNGMQLAPVSDGSALIPGTLPLFVTALAVLVYRQSLSHHRVIGLCLIVVGIAIFLHYGASAGHHQLHGYLVLLVASFMWSVFTICARVAALNALAVAGWVSLLSSLTLAFLIGTGVVPSTLASVGVTLWPYDELLRHLLLQGVGAGIIAAFTYLHAIAHLGAERSAAFAATTPAIATLLAWFFLQESASAVSLLALGCISLGSIIASNVFLKNDQSVAFTVKPYTVKPKAANAKQP
ncbi:DMT family transporter [Vibrio cholerae]